MRLCNELLHNRISVALGVPAPVLRSHVEPPRETQGTSGAAVTLIGATGGSGTQGASDLERLSDPIWNVEVLGCGK